MKYSRVAFDIAWQIGRLSNASGLSLLVFCRTGVVSSALKGSRLTDGTETVCDYLFGL